MNSEFPVTDDWGGGGEARRPFERAAEGVQKACCDSL